MKLKIIPNKKVLKSANLNFNNFTVITGENGSGKTQFLSFVNSFQNSNYYDELGKLNYHITKDSGEKYRNVISSSPGLFSPLKNSTSVDIIKEIKEHWRDLEVVFDAYNYLPDIEPYKLSSEDIEKLNEKFSNFLEKMQTSSYPIQFRKIQKSELESAYNLSKRAGIAPKDFNFDIFFTFYPVYTNNIFSPNVDFLFHQFELKKINYPALIKEVKHPLDILNEILIAANFRYLAEYTFSNNLEIVNKVIFTDRENSDVKIDIDNLSSGEKTIMSLMFTLYSSTTNGIFPDLILFDEPDAHLHPSMTKMFLDVVQDVLIKQNGVDVIMTTHSPSTVAIAPEDSIYYMKRDVGYPVKISQGEAINSLIYGINGLFVSHENRRQVFVESEKDERFYEYIYNSIKDKLNKDVQLIFIASSKTKIASNGDGIGTREQVEKITKIMRDSDNKQIWGIVDWDKRPTKHPNVVRIGNGKRYTIENYLLDPLLLGILLIKDGLVLPNVMGLTHSNYLSLAKSYNNKDFQIITDWVLKHLKLYTEKSEELRLEKLVNGMEIKLPIKFLEMKGHDFENNLSKKIHKLGTVTSSQSNDNSIKLKMAIIERVLFDLPELISNDFLTTFKYIQETR